MDKQTAYNRIQAALEARRKEQEPLADDTVRTNPLEDGMPSESGGRTYQRSSITLDRALRGTGKIIQPTRGA
jgi:hypothetical protein